MSPFSSAARTPRSDPADTPAIRIMLVDDSAVIRGLYTKMIEADPELRIVASVANGQMALAMLERLAVDVIVLDIEMPVMDGLTALPKLLAACPGAQVIMSSTLSVAGAEVSLQAMQNGAADCVAKPTATSAIRGGLSFGAELLGKIKALGRRSSVAVRPAAPSAAEPATPIATPASPGLYRGKTVSLRPLRHGRPEIIAIGASTGGPQALLPIMRALSPEIRQPIVLTQHMPATFTRVLAQHVGLPARRPCSEAEDCCVIAPGRIYVAPGGYHMVAESQGAARRLRLLDTPPENFCRPAVDPMLRSLAETYGARVLTIILTGMGQDGMRGAAAIVAAGGNVAAQDEATSVVWGMPGAAATAGLCCAVLPLAEIGLFLNRLALSPAR